MSVRYTIHLTTVNSQCAVARIEFLVCGKAGGKVARHEENKLGVICVAIFVACRACGGGTWIEIGLGKLLENECWHESSVEKKCVRQYEELNYVTVVIFGDSIGVREPY